MRADKNSAYLLLLNKNLAWLKLKMLLIRGVSFLRYSHTKKKSGWLGWFSASKIDVENWKWSIFECPQQNLLIINQKIL